MKIVNAAFLPPSRQLSAETAPSASLMRRPASGRSLSEKANPMPIERGVEGELLKGRRRAGAPVHQAWCGQTYRGEYRADGGTSARRAISVYLFHAHPTLHSPEHVIDVFA